MLAAGDARPWQKCDTDGKTGAEQLQAMRKA